jgi:hypothetical protein
MYRLALDLVQMDVNPSLDRQAWMPIQLRQIIPIRLDPDLQHYLHVTSLSLRDFKANL